MTFYRPQVGDIVMWDSAVINGPDVPGQEYWFVVKVNPPVLGEYDFVAWHMHDNFLSDSLTVCLSNERAWKLVCRL
jgi:predicted ATP-grasp superfamily ATP-dependent carboligase